jgi:hypothetical protein
MPTIKIHNAETGEVVEREMNADELEKLEKVQTEAAKRAEFLAAQAEKKAAAEAKLEGLGLTADDLKALGL